MEQTFPKVNQTDISFLEAHLREAFARVAYSHKTHEKCADVYHSRQSRVKLVQIGFSAVTTGGLMSLFAADTMFAKILATACSTMLFALNAYMKQHDLGEITVKHANTATKLWGLRESYLCLLTDLRSGVVSPSKAVEKRDELQKALLAVYQAAPRTLDKAYGLAQKALQVKEELTFSNEEIDKLLPMPLRRGQP